MSDTTTRENREMVYQTDVGEDIKLTRNIVRDLLVRGDPSKISDKELIMYMQLCKYQKLNPYLNEVHLIKYGSDPATIVVGKETYTKRANREPRFNGFEAGVYVSRSNGEIDQRKGAMVLPDETLVGGWSRIHIEGWAIPLEVSVSLNEYIGKKKDGTPNRQWARMPATMIRKVALVQGLREAFPEQFGGLYDASEMGVDDSAFPTDPVDVTATVDDGPTKENQLKDEIKAILSADGVVTQEEKDTTLSELEEITEVSTLQVLLKRFKDKVQETVSEEQPEDEKPAFVPQQEEIF